MANGFFQKRRRARSVWILLPLVLAAYLVLFPVPGGKESYLRPVWAVQLTEPRAVNAASTAVSTAGSFPFRVGDLFGYATSQGGLLHLERVLFGVSLCSTGFINYGQMPDHFVFMNPLGQMQYSLASSGYPLLGEDGRALYAVASDLGSIRRLDEGGDVIWSLGFASQITSLALDGQQCVLGLLDGRVLSVGPRGEVLYEYSPSGSRIPVVLSVAVAPKGSPIAAVVGIDPQRLLLIEREGAALAPTLTLDLGSDFRREILLRFGGEGRFLYVEGVNELRVLDVRKHRLSTLPLPGRVRGLAGGGVLTAVAVRGELGMRLLVFRPLQTVLCEMPLGSDRPFLKVLDDALFVGQEGYLLRADIVSG
jgi:hypothetical protein